jgi:hypothetical protein
MSLDAWLAIYAWRKDWRTHARARERTTTTSRGWSPLNEHRRMVVSTSGRQVSRGWFTSISLGQLPQQRQRTRYRIFSSCEHGMPASHDATWDKGMRVVEASVKLHASRLLFQALDVRQVCQSLATDRVSVVGFHATTERLNLMHVGVAKVHWLWAVNWAPFRRLECVTTSRVR